MRRALVMLAALAASGCVTQEYVRSLTYDYADGRRLAAERRATQEMQDACYLSGAQRFELDGPPQIVTEGAAPGQAARVTQAFYCVGTQGGP